jgi:hypothetical protein
MTIFDTNPVEYWEDYDKEKLRLREISKSEEHYKQGIEKLLDYLDLKYDSNDKFTPKQEKTEEIIVDF